jgi:hypothetical protein
LQGITKNTLKVFNAIKHYKELKHYYLVGGTGLSIHVGHRLSEDLDLFYYNQYPGQRQKLPELQKILEKFKKDFKDFFVYYHDEYDAYSAL